ncbi:DUF6950 family protein [Xanthobacter sp. TB0139]|uniref:DUF6950 family protein n=1 Tax=Xanthobacter sp. TB0139 TaxID=3459178 RepID=UPI00403A0ABD
MTRLRHWPDRLDDVIAAYQGGIFVWGERDCWRLVLATVEAVSGAAIYADLPAYDSATGAARLLVERGFNGIGDALAAALPEVPPSLAQRGDVGVIDEAGGEAGVVVIGADVLGMAPAGLTRLPRARLKRAFRAG